MKFSLGNILLIVIGALTVALWFFVRQGTFIFPNYDIATHSLGQITGLIGMTFFSLMFILTTRLKFVEKAFKGLDKVYKTHHILGATVFVLLLFHPILLVLNFIPGNVTQAAVYLWPSGSWAVNFGIIALVGMALLIVLTLYVNMKYPNWKLSHKFMGLVYVVAIAHIFMVRTDITYYPLLRDYMIVLSCIGVISYVYGSFIGPRIRNKVVYLVDSVEKNGRINIIELKPKGDELRFNAGQFVFIRFGNENVGKEQHPFTIASSPLDKKIRFAVKDLGDYTSNLKELNKGDFVELEGPYGRFNLDENKEQVWIAGGIGITPFLSMANQIQRANRKNAKITLFYCTKDREEAVFLEELSEISKSVNNFRIIPWYSDEKGRINVDLISKIIDIKNKKFMICGPGGMMESLSTQLIENGVSREEIAMEDFDLK